MGGEPWSAIWSLRSSFGRTNSWFSCRSSHIQGSTLRWEVNPGQLFGPSRAVLTVQTRGFDVDHHIYGGSTLTWEMNPGQLFGPCGAVLARTNSWF